MHFAGFNCCLERCRIGMRYHEHDSSYGILRDLSLVHRRDGGGNPSELLITDRPLLICVALWGLVTTLVIYRPLGL